jgi:two-component system response regulator PilR (NtrC family)
LRVPPLRERRGDVPQLAAFILRSLAAKSGGTPGRLKPDAQQALEEYDFPGNVRELENILERAMAMCEGDTIEASDLMLPQRPLRQAEPVSAAHAAMHAPQPGAPVASQPTVPHAGPGSGVPLDDYISNLERTAIIKALEESRYNKTAAAKKLGITFRALRYKLKKLGID